MNFNNTLEKVERLRAEGFDITELELDTILNSPVRTNDLAVIRSAVVLSRHVNKSLLALESVDFSNNLKKIFKDDPRFITASAFAIYTLAKTLCEIVHGGTITVEDKAFYEKLEHIEEYKAQRELIRKHFYTMVFDFENKVLRTHGLSRLSDNKTNAIDVDIDVSDLTKSEIELLRSDIQNFCNLRIRAGKYPTVPLHLQGFSIYRHEDKGTVETFEPLIVPGKISRGYFKAIK